MPKEQAVAAADPKRSGLRLAALAGLVVLSVSAAVYATSFATRQLAEDGAAAQQAEAVLGSNALAFKALGQVVLLAEDRALGVAGDDVVAAAVGEAAAALDRLDVDAQLLVAVPGTDPTIAGAAAAVIERGAVVLSAADAGQTAAAAGALVESRTAFEEMRDVTAAERDRRVAFVASATAISGNISTAARFLVAFLLPLGAVIAYRYAARRQLRVAEIQLDSRLEAEHEVIRAKDEFIANMSHELRTPLTSIYGFSEILLEQGLLDPAGAMELVAMINTESAELGRMVEDLLISARSEAGTLALTNQPVDLSAELEAVLIPLRRSSHRFESDIDEQRVWADPLRVRQILRNLLSNAVRHGGTNIMVTGMANSDRVVIVVADDGDGVPEDLVPKLFTRFVHEGNEALTEGSVGLGLAVVNSLAEAMGGGVAYERNGDWTRFVFWLLPAPHGIGSSEEADDARWVA